MHHLNSQEYALFLGYFVLEIIVTDCTHSKSAKFWLMYVPAPLECSILERTLLVRLLWRLPAAQTRRQLPLQQPPKLVTRPTSLS